MNECKECGNMFNPPKCFTEEVRRYSLTSFCKDCEKANTTPKGTEK